MDNLLENINSPDDLKNLSVDQLKELAEQIRQFLLDSISKTGGPTGFPMPLDKRKGCCST